ncbi:MAG: hypothetical protein K0S82_1794 [Gaiellaceae bacterium]|nr:hypothetical protein [Gaiellaceae bacterium]
MPSAHSNIAAAVGAGFKQITTDRGAASSVNDRFEVTLEKHLVGGALRRGSIMRATGQGATQGAAETAAVASLNAQRDLRYGKSGSGKDSDLNSLATDVA